MALVTIQNKTSSDLLLPPPVSKKVTGNGSITVTMLDSDLQTASFVAAQQRGVIAVTRVADDPTVPDILELNEARQKAMGVCANATVTTTDATVTTALSVSIPVGSAVHIHAKVICREVTTGTTVGGYDIIAVGNNIGGTSAIVGAAAAVATIESNAALAATIDVDNTTDTARVRVTGIAATNLRWFVGVEVLSLAT